MIYRQAAVPGVDFQRTTRILTPFHERKSLVKTGNDTLPAVKNAPLLFLVNDWLKNRHKKRNTKEARLRQRQS